MAINNPGVSELKKRTDSVYTLVELVAKRARQLVDTENQIYDADTDKPLHIAIQEVARGQLTYHRPMEGDI